MSKIAPTTKNILIVAGDPSGDVYGANLIKELKARDPELIITSIGGTRMKSQSSHFIYNLVSVGAVGFSEPFKRFFLWFKLLQLIRYYMDEKRPACLITIDFYGLNHQILGMAMHRKIPAFYYIPPQVWASRPKRAESIARLTKRIFCIYPFEKEIYEKLNAEHDFVGHPIIDIIDEYKEGNLRPQEDMPAWKIGILPGSRKFEIKKHLPIFTEAFCKIKSVYPNSKGYIFAVAEVPDKMILDLISETNPDCKNDIEIVRETNYNLRSQMHLALTCSGTATLENALLGIPMIVAYKMNFLNYAIARKLITIKHISLVNILLKKNLVKELVQKKASAENISQEAFTILSNPQKFAVMQKELLTIRNMLGKKGVASRVAESILEYLK